MALNINYHDWVGLKISIKPCFFSIGAFHFSHYVNRFDIFIEIVLTMTLLKTKSEAINL